MKWHTVSVEVFIQGDMFERFKKKLCTDCGEMLPLKDFGTRPNNNKTNKIYYKTFCKPCMVQRTNRWREKNVDKHNEYQRRYQREHYKRKKRER